MNRDQCRHRHCCNPVKRLGICNHHYWELKGGRPKQRPLLKTELENIDPDELWEWVKTELGKNPKYNYLIMQPRQ